MDNPSRAAVTLNGVKAIGLEIAIDDFGTGYSSLSYLHRFHIDTLKIDRSFVSTATMNAGSMEVVRAVAGLAHNLGLDIVGEGVEQPEQVTLLRDLQCEYGQGYFFSKPVARRGDPRAHRARKRPAAALQRHGLRRTPKLPEKAKAPAKGGLPCEAGWQRPALRSLSRYWS